MPRPARGIADIHSPVLVGILEAFGEDFTDALAEALKRGAGSVSQMDAVRNGLIHLFSVMTPAQVQTVSRLLKPIARLGQSAAKRWVRDKLTAKGVDPGLIEVFVDGVDDLGETMIRHGVDSLDASNTQAYIDESVRVLAAKKGVAPPATGTTAPSTTTPAAPSGTGAPMPTTAPPAGGQAPATTPHHAPAASAPKASAKVLAVEAAIGHEGRLVIQFWRRLLRDAITDDAPDELKGARAELEATLAAWESAPERVGEMILSELEAGASTEDAAWTVLDNVGMAHTGGASREARLGDLGDRVIDGEVKREAAEAVKSLGKKAGPALKWGLIFYAAASILAAGLVIASAVMIIFYFQNESPGIGLAVGIGICGCLVGALVSKMTSWAENAVAHLKEPFGWLANLVKQVAAAWGVITPSSNNNPTPPASAGGGAHNV